MATNLAELRHYYSHRHQVDRQNLVRRFDSVTKGIEKITNNSKPFLGWQQRHHFDEDSLRGRWN